MLEFLGIPLLSWVNSAGILSLVGLWWRRDVALRKIASSEAGDLRDSYAEELAAVRAERAQDRKDALGVERHLREMVDQSDRRHEECEQSRRSMRTEMDEMHAEIAGLKRQIPEVSADKLLVLESNGKPRPSEAAPHAAASAERVKKITEGDK